MSPLLPLLLLSHQDPAAQADPGGLMIRRVVVFGVPRFTYVVDAKPQKVGDVIVIRDNPDDTIRLATGAEANRQADEWLATPTDPIPKALRSIKEPIVDVTRFKEGPSLWYRVRTLAKGPDGKDAIRDSQTVVTQQGAFRYVFSFSHFRFDTKLDNEAKAILKFLKGLNDVPLFAEVPIGMYEVAAVDGLQYMVPGVFRWQPYPKNELRMILQTGADKLMIQSFKLGDEAKMLVSKNLRGGDLKDQDKEVKDRLYVLEVKDDPKPYPLKVRGNPVAATRMVIRYRSEAPLVYTTIPLSPSVAIHIFQPENKPESWRSTFGIEP